MGSSWIDETKQIKDELLVFGFIRAHNEQNIISIKLIELFLIFYYEDTQIPETFTISQLSAEDIADQITLIDAYLFNKIECREFMDHDWDRRVIKDESSPNLVNMIKQFDNVTRFVQIEILQEKSVNSRCCAITRIIKMGQRFRELNNYNSLSAVYNALNSPPIQRLKMEWKEVSEKYMTIFAEFEGIFYKGSSVHSGPDHRNLRISLRSSTAPCIPFIGIILEDLASIDNEKNFKYIKNPIFYERNKLDSDECKFNFNKYVKMVDMIRDIKRYQICNYNGNNGSYNQITNDFIVQKWLSIRFEKARDIIKSND